MLEEKLKELEKDLDKYCGDYGTLESRLEKTLWLILDILKELEREDKEEVIINERDRKRI